MDFEETFTPIARYETLRMLLALSAHRKWPIYQLDVEAALLTGDMEEEVYMEQPEGFAVKGMEHMVCKLKKAIYGLDQAPRGWYGRLASFFERNGFEKSGIQPTLYAKKEGNDSLLLVCVYGDDLIYMGSSHSVTTEFKERMVNVFKMSDLGKMHSFLELEIKQCEDGVFVSQSKYAEHLLKQFNVPKSNAAITPMSVGERLELKDGTEWVDARMFRDLVRGLVHLTHTRPDIAFAVGVVSRFVRNPTKQHFRDAKRILRYIAGTRDFGIWYSNVAGFKLVGFTDSDWAGSLEDVGSISGSVFNFGSGAVTWSSKREGVAALSTTEAEYMAVTTSACRAMWLRRLVADLGEEQKEATEIFCDNVAVTKNPFMHGRTEHIDNQFDLIRNLVTDGIISFKFCSSDEQVGDILTKPLPSEKHIKFRARLGVCSYESRGVVN